MEVISIDGVEYVRAAVIAKRFKYTSDYVGQLCRSGKVDAKLVGRTWYVNPDSLTGHKSTRYIKVGQSEKTSDSNVKLKISRQTVEPVVRKETVKSLASTTEQKQSNFLRRIEWKPLKYETDTADLLPQLGSPEPKKVSIGLADAAKVKIKGGSETTELVTEPLPEVSLGGSIKISSLDDDFEKDLENIAIPDEELLGELVEVTAAADTTSLGEEESDQHVSPTQSISADLQNPSYPVAVRKAARSRFAPARVERVSEVERGSSWLPWFGVLIFALVGLISVLSVEFVFESNSQSTTSTFSFVLPTL